MTVSLEQVRAMNEALDVRRLVLEEEVPEKLIRNLAKAPLVESLAPRERNPLTDREVDVVTLAADGLHNREIAEVLGIGEESVRSYAKAAFVKLGARGRANAVAIALTRGLIRFRDTA